MEKKKKYTINKKRNKLKIKFGNKLGVRKKI